MNDTQFDHLFREQFKDHVAPVPAGLWEQVVEGQFDQFVGQQMKDHVAPLPAGLWDKIADAHFDAMISDQMAKETAPVSEGLWDRITDAHFDQHISNQLNQATATIPSGLWEKVNPQKEDDHRFLFSWLKKPMAALFLLGFIAGTAGIFYSLHNPSLDSSTQLTIGKTAEVITNQQIQSDKPVLSDKQNRILTHEENQNIPLSKQLSITDQETLSPQINLPKASVLSMQTKPGLPAILSSLPLSQIEMAEENYSPSRLLTGMPLLAYEKKSAGQTMLENKTLPTLNHTNQFRNIVICPTGPKSISSEWYLETYGSADLGFKSVTNLSASANHLSKKDSSESNLLSYSAGLRLVKPLSENLLIKAGIQYGQLNQKYVYRIENEVKITQVISIRTIIRAPGDTLIVRDTSMVQTIGFRNNTVFNRYRSLDIPITLGYQFGNEEMKIGLNAGVVFNVSSWYQGVVLDSSLATVPLNKTGNNIYKTKIGMGLVGSISLVKKIKEGMHVFIEPHFRYNLSNMTTQQNPYQQKFTVGGLAIGLRMNLNQP